MIDALWIATSGVEYWLSELLPCDEIFVEYVIDNHPCDDLPYVANLSVWGHDGHAVIGPVGTLNDGRDGG